MSVCCVDCFLAIGCLRWVGSGVLTSAETTAPPGRRRRPRNSKPYLIYLDHTRREIVLAVRGLNLKKESDYKLLLNNRLGMQMFEQSSSSKIKFPSSGYDSDDEMTSEIGFFATVMERILWGCDLGVRANDRVLCRVLPEEKSEDGLSTDLVIGERRVAPAAAIVEAEEELRRAWAADGL